MHAEVFKQSFAEHHQQSTTTDSRINYLTLVYNIIWVDYQLLFCFQDYVLKLLF